MATFITRLDPTGDGPRLAVKDLIDVAGTPTTAGCRAVAERAGPARRDAACLAGARAAGARLVGKANLHELALGVTGVNPWFGTPVNPLDPDLVPGGSSSGSAVAVATGEADVAYGTDTGGSVRIPSACCGTVGLKTTFGRVPVDGVWPLAPSFDTVGPMARDVAGVALGMALLEPGFVPAAAPSPRVGRLRVEADPRIDAAVDTALAATGWEVTELLLPEWEEVTAQAGLLLVAEAWREQGRLVRDHPDGVSRGVAERMRLGADVDAAAVAAARDACTRWRRRLEAVFTEVELIAVPTLTIFPPRLDDGDALLLARTTLPVNAAGVPALSLPVPAGRLPASLQLVAGAGREELLVAAGAGLEEAAAA